MTTTDTSELRAAYAELIAIAEAGGFGPPPAGQWRAELVMAHMAANDARLAAVTEAVLAGSEASYDNDGLWEEDSAALEDYVAAHPDLVAELRKNSSQLFDLVDQLDDTTFNTVIPTHLTHAGQVVVDGPMPWGQVVAGASMRHIAMHTSQLRDLQTG